jgi:hypothetical protein
MQEVDRGYRENDDNHDVRHGDPEKLMIAEEEIPESYYELMPLQDVGRPNSPEARALAGQPSEPSWFGRYICIH